jgi:cytochrome c biogenesis factor
MKTRRTLRLISLIMLIVAVVFVFCALSNPALGKVFYIGSIKIGADIKRAFYAVYAIIMVALFGISFFVKDKK